MTLFERLVSAPGGSLEEIFPEADMVCVVDQYRTSRRTLEPYGIEMSFWESTAVLENEVLLVLIKNLKVIAEQSLKTYPPDHDGEALTLFPVNTCFQRLKANVEVTKRQIPPLYEIFDGQTRILTPSFMKVIVEIVEVKEGQ